MLASAGIFSLAWVGPSCQPRPLPRSDECSCRHGTAICRTDLAEDFKLTLPSNGAPPTSTKHPAMTAPRIQPFSLFTSDRSPYIGRMQRRLLSWLMPIFVLLALLAGSSAASAHPGHGHGDSVHRINAGFATTSVRPVDAAARTSRLSETGAPCDCPGDHCNCSIDCLAFCSAASAIVDDASLQFLPARPIFAPMPAKAGVGWTPGADPDPPRPSA